MYLVGGAEVRGSGIHLPDEDKHGNVDHGNRAPGGDEASHEASVGGVEHHRDGDEEGSGVDVDVGERIHNGSTCLRIVGRCLYAYKL